MQPTCIFQDLKLVSKIMNFTSPMKPCVPRPQTIVLGAEIYVSEIKSHPHIVYIIIISTDLVINLTSNNLSRLTVTSHIVERSSIIHTFRLM